MTKLNLSQRVLAFAMLVASFSGCGMAVPPAPAINNLSPASAPAGSSAITLTLNGSNFSKKSTIQWNSTALATTFNGGTQLTATVPQSSLTTAGTVAVTVYDDRNAQTSNAATFTISAPSSGTGGSGGSPTPLQITTSSLPNAQAGVAYSATLTATGGTSPYAWTVASGSLPGGISLATNGTLTGTPNTAGQYTFTAQAKDSASTPQAATTSLTLSVGAQALKITTTSLPPATVNSSYSTNLAGTGGVAPYSWSLVSGSLPNGLTLSSSGTISGTATASGTFNFTAQLKDAAGATTSSALSLTSSGVTRFYSSTSFWNQPIAASPAIDPNSASMVSNSIMPYANTGLLNDTDFGMAFVIAQAGDPVYNVQCTLYCDQGTSFQVQIPLGTVPTTGSDHHLTVVNGTREYDMWVASYNSSNNTWSALEVNYTDLWGWGAECAQGQHCNGPYASGFAGMGGIIRPEEIQQGHIDHALSLAIPRAKSGYIACPATHTDGGSTAVGAIPEGALIQLDPAFNVDAQSWLPWQKMVAKAMQKYGARVSDQTGSVLAWYGQTDQNRGNISWSSVGVNNSTGRSFGNFPWGSVRVLQIQSCN